MALLAGRLETAPRAKVIVLYSGLWNLIVQANLPAFQVDTRNTIGKTRVRLRLVGRGVLMCVGSRPVDHQSHRRSANLELQ